MTAIQVFLSALLLGYFLGVLVRVFYVERGPRRPHITLHASRLPTVIINDEDVEPETIHPSSPPPLPPRARSEFPAMRADLPPMRDRMTTLPKIDLALIERSKKEILS